MLGQQYITPTYAVGSDRTSELSPLSWKFIDSLSLIVNVSQQIGYRRACQDFSNAVTEAFEQENSAQTGSSDEFGRVIVSWMETLVTRSVRGANTYQTSGESEMNVISELRREYRIDDPVAVAGVLAKHPKMSAFLLEAIAQIRNVFGIETTVKLELVIDGELSDEPVLSARILTSLSVDEALSRLDEVDEDWFLDNIGRAEGVFNFDVEWE